MDNHFIDYYAILHISPSASQEEVKAAYRKLAKENHPDHGGSEFSMQRINEAYETLGDENKRAEYDWMYFVIESPPPPTPTKITVHILDPWDDIDYHTTQENSSAFGFDITDYLYNGELYAYKKAQNKGFTLITYADFAALLASYHADKIECMVKTRFMERFDILPVSSIEGNYRIYLTPGNNLLYVKEHKNKYIPISEEEFTRLKSERERKESHIKSTISYMGIAFLVGAAIVGYCMDAFSPKASQQPETHHESETETKTAIQPPEHNSTLKDFPNHDPNFTIQSSYSTSAQYYYLKIVDSISKEVVQAVFFEAGRTASVYVPNGTYIIKWVCGNQWYGYEEYFLTNSAMQADDTFTFDDYTGWEVTLYSVSNGNLETAPIDISNF